MVVVVVVVVVAAAAAVVVVVVVAVVVVVVLVVLVVVAVVAVVAKAVPHLQHPLPGQHPHAHHPQRLQQAGSGAPKCTEPASAFANGSPYPRTLLQLWKRLRPQDHEIIPVCMLNISMRLPAAGAPV